MRVQVELRREGGAYRAQHGERLRAIGQLSLSYRTANGRRVPVLHLLGSDRGLPSLFEPRLVAWAGAEFKFLGFQRDDRAWVLQEWDCELLL